MSDADKLTTRSADQGLSMEESDCDLFSIKLEDIHLVSTRPVVVNQHSGNEPLSEVTQRNSQDLDGSISITNYWPIYENVHPDVTQELAFQSLIADDSSIDFGHELYFPTCQADFLTEASPVEAKPSKADLMEKIAVSYNSRASSPNLFSRSRPVSPNLSDVNGGDKKRKKYEREDVVSKDLSIVAKRQSCVDVFETPQVLSRRPSGASPPILIPSPLLTNASNHMVLEPDWATGDQPMSNHHVLISTSVLADLPDRLPSIVECQVMPSSQMYLQHCRSLSTSPEFRDAGFADRKESRIIGSDAAKEAKEKIPRHKRPSHINAELRRRYKIQTYVEDLNQLLPPISGGMRTNIGGSKKSKSALLERAAGYCRQLKAESREADRESDALRTEIEALTADIKRLQVEMPSNGVEQVTVKTQVTVEEMFDVHVHAQTRRDWKFYIFSLFMRPMFVTYCQVVESLTVDRFLQTLDRWSQQHFTLAAFRDLTTEVQCHIAKKTSFLKNPERVRDEALAATTLRSVPPNLTESTPVSDSASTNGALPCHASTRLSRDPTTKSGPPSRKQSRDRSRSSCGSTASTSESTKSSYASSAKSSYDGANSGFASAKPSLDANNLNFPTQSTRLGAVDGIAGLSTRGGFEQMRPGFDPTNPLGSELSRFDPTRSSLNQIRPGFDQAMPNCSAPMHNFASKSNRSPANSKLAR